MGTPPYAPRGTGTKKTLPKSQEGAERGQRKRIVAVRELLQGDSSQAREQGEEPAHAEKRNLGQGGGGDAVFSRCKAKRDSDSMSYAYLFKYIIIGDTGESRAQLSVGMPRARVLCFEVEDA